MVGDGGARWRGLIRLSYRLHHYARWSYLEARRPRCPLCQSEIDFEAQRCAECDQQQMLRWAERQWRRT